MPWLGVAAALPAGSMTPVSMCTVLGSWAEAVTSLFLACGLRLLAAKGVAPGATKESHPVLGQVIQEAPV